MPWKATVICLPIRHVIKVSAFVVRRIYVNSSVKCLWEWDPINIRNPLKFLISRAGGATRITDQREIWRRRVGYSFILVCQGVWLWDSIKFKIWLNFNQCEHGRGNFSQQIWPWLLQEFGMDPKLEIFANLKNKFDPYGHKLIPWAIETKQSFKVLRPVLCCIISKFLLDRQNWCWYTYPAGILMPCWLCLRFLSIIFFTCEKLAEPKPR